LALPQAPLSGPPATAALQATAAPPFSPLQAQFQGPELMTAVGLPAAQRPVAGGALRLAPFDEPHCPGTAPAAALALHDVVKPPFKPVQFHNHGPVPLTGVGRPDIHRFDGESGGALSVCAPAGPQTPFVKARAPIPVSWPLASTASVRHNRAPAARLARIR
jgi:hypothetical protein